MDIIIDDKSIDEFYYAKHPIYTQLQICILDIDTGEEWCYVSEIEQFLSKSKNTITEEINFDNIEERIGRYQVQGNSLKFDSISINHVNDSLRIVSYSRGGRR